MRAQQSTSWWPQSLDDARRDELLQELREASSRRRLFVGHVVRLDRLEEPLDELHYPHLLSLVEFARELGAEALETKHPQSASVLFEKTTTLLLIIIVDYELTLAKTADPKADEAKTCSGE